MAMTDEQNADIRAFVQANSSDPGAIAQGMIDYGVSAADLSNALNGWNGFDTDSVQDWVSRVGISTGNGADFGGNTSAKKGVYTDWYAERNATEAVNQAQRASVAHLINQAPAGTTMAASSSGPTYKTDNSFGSGAATNGRTPEQLANIRAAWADYESGKMSAASIQQAMQQYGVNYADIASALNIPVDQVYAKMPAPANQSAPGAGQGQGSPGNDLSLTQQSLLKALADQAERDQITGEIRTNASELYDRATQHEQAAMADAASYEASSKDNARQLADRAGQHEQQANLDAASYEAGSKQNARNLADRASQFEQGANADIADYRMGAKLNAAALADRTRGYEADAARDIGVFTGGNSGIYDRYKGDIENDVGTAVADARNGQIAALNSAARQALRYGVGIPTGFSGLNSSQASQLASAANTTRNNAIANYRNLVGQGIGLKQDAFKVGQAGMTDAMNRSEASDLQSIGLKRDTFGVGQSAMMDSANRWDTASLQSMGLRDNAFKTGQSALSDSMNRYDNALLQGIGLRDNAFRTSQAATADAMGRAEGATMANRNMRVQDESLDWAKQLDVTGMARGMPGASNGAYGVAVGAGNSAVQNQMAPGQALIGAMGQSNNTTMQGQNTAMQGLTGVLNAQTSYANANANTDSFGSLLGGLGGAAAGMAKLGVFS